MITDQPERNAEAQIRQAVHFALEEGADRRRLAEILEHVAAETQLGQDVL